MTDKQKLLHYYKMDVLNATQQVYQIKADLEAERGWMEEFSFRNMEADFNTAQQRVKELLEQLDNAIYREAEAEVQLEELEKLLEQAKE